MEFSLQPAWANPGLYRHPDSSSEKEVGSAPPVGARRASDRPELDDPPGRSRHERQPAGLAYGGLRQKKRAPAGAR
jgi:hypothetical protein